LSVICFDKSSAKVQLFFLLHKLFTHFPAWRCIGIFAHLTTIWVKGFQLFLGIEPKSPKRHHFTKKQGKKIVLFPLAELMLTFLMQITQIAALRAPVRSRALRGFTDRLI